MDNAPCSWTTATANSQSAWNLQRCVGVCVFGLVELQCSNNMLMLMLWLVMMPYACLCVCHVSATLLLLLFATSTDQVGADLCMGSLIKSPGGTITPGGGYVAGRADLVAAAAARLTAPGVGLDAGCVAGETLRLMFQGVCVVSP